MIYYLNTVIFVKLIIVMMLKKKKYRVLGVMSGTSLDGIDLALVDLYTDPWNYNIIKTSTIAYTDNWINLLSNIYDQDLSRIKKIDISYTDYLGTIINKFISDNKIYDIDFVSSHGHTAKHLPDDQITYQLGNLSSINDKYNLTTICDFRKQDIDLGGQGAPLVPIGDKILFSKYSACLNFGGFANISREFCGVRIAYDICSVNLVFNYLAQIKSMPYDKNGKLARSGCLIEPLYNKLNKIEFYNLPYPKSLGVEWVVNEIYPLIQEECTKSSIEDVMHTYLMHIVLKISDCFQDDDTILITGGGALNTYLIEVLRNNTKANIIIPSRELIEFKEALIFGLLGLLRFLNINNSLSSITGASINHCSGNIFRMK